MTAQICPRRLLEAGPWSSEPEPIDRWAHREQFANGLVALHCSHCGSLHPGVFMEKVREGWHVGGTDKGYKFYLDRPLTDEEIARARQRWEDGFIGQALKERGADLDAEWAGPRGAEVWATPRQVSKLYTPHLGRAHAREFVALWKAGTLNHSIYRKVWLPSLADDAPAWLHQEDAAPEAAE